MRGAPSHKRCRAARGRAARLRVPGDRNPRPAHALGVVLAPRQSLLLLAAPPRARRSARVRRRPRALPSPRAESPEAVLALARVGSAGLEGPGALAPRARTRAARLRSGCLLGERFLVCRHLRRHVRAVSEQRHPPEESRRPEHVHSPHHATEPLAGLVGEGRVALGPLLHRSDDRRGERRLHVLVVFKAPGAERDGEELLVRGQGLLGHDQAALAGAPVTGDANSDRQEARVAQDQQQLVDEELESEQVDPGLVVSPHVAIVDRTEQLVEGHSDGRAGTVMGDSRRLPKLKAPKELHTWRTLEFTQAQPKKKSPMCGAFAEPLTDSSRRPPPYHGGFEAVLAYLAGHSRPSFTCKSTDEAVSLVP